MTPTPCPICGCTTQAGTATHAIAAAVAGDDLDRAIEIGLLGVEACVGCDAGCTSTLLAARDERRRALAARERHRSRDARLQRRQRERDAQRASTRPPPADSAADTPLPAAPSLPSAAAAALARARAKAAQRHKP